MRDWYNDEPGRPKPGEPTQVSRTLADCLHHWSAIELDLDDKHIDLESGVLHTRSWRWLRTRITGLAADPHSRLHKALTKGA